ncbi:Na/Pi cotransporter family protein [Luteimonas saliphila]|uniref:Na/Pi cotransporter family protein n=1 Tax=Luteimonas saliphila TaxID=2804919 RepID=UPI00192D47BE|nr:Na/Pi symporter [Luteimonas saliphila]
MRLNIRVVVLVAAAAVLGWTFWRNAGWLQLSAGLAIFLFGMQCLEEGLRQLAGGKLEQLLARSTGTPARGLLFGMGGTFVLQSSTLVSLLTIAFISSGLIQLTGGIAIILGANLGSTSGIWLLALAGQDISLSPLALPLLVFGVLAGFTGTRGKAAGRVVLGVAFVFLGIDQIKDGFEAVGGGIDLTAVGSDGVAGTLLFVLVGLVATVVLQSSHATLMLTLAALASGQLGLEQGLAIAIGSNVGSSVSTAIVGALGGNRSGQRLALAHVLFNATTALTALLLLLPLTWLVRLFSGAIGFGDNALLQLALFHTLFNAIGVALFWSWQDRLARRLARWLPDRLQDGGVAVPDVAATPAPGDGRALHLSAQALESADAAAAAVSRELRHLGRLGLEVICEALYLPRGQLVAKVPDEELVRARPAAHHVEADTLYRSRIKGVYGDLLDFMGRFDMPLDEDHQRFWTQSQMAALQMVKAVKDAGDLQLNLRRRLDAEDSPLREAYVELRRHLLSQLRAFHRLGVAEVEGETLHAALAVLASEADGFGEAMRGRLFAMVRAHQVDGLQAGSLMNDLGYADRIVRGARAVMAARDEPASLRELRRLAAEAPVG